MKYLHNNCKSILKHSIGFYWNQRKIILANTIYLYPHLKISHNVHEKPTVNKYTLNKQGRKDRLHKIWKCKPLQMGRRHWVWKPTDRPLRKWPTGQKVFLGLSVPCPCRHYSEHWLTCSSSPFYKNLKTSISSISGF